MFCPKCGTQVPDNAAFCVNCGSPLSSVNAPQRPSQTQPYMPPPGYMLVPTNQPNGWQQQQGGYPPNQWQGWQQPNALPVQQPAPQAPLPKAEEPKQKKEQVPDPTFTKFVDAPDPPLPFWGLKIAMGVISLAGTGWALFRAYKIGTIGLLMGGMFENVPGIPFLTLAFIWLVSGICTALSKFSRGAAGTGGVCYLIAAGMAFIARNTYPDDPLLILTLVSILFGLIVLISAAGGVNLDFDE